MIKIIFNDITEDKMDELEEIFINTLGVYTEIYEGTTKDCFRYVLEVEDNDTLLVDDEELQLLRLKNEVMKVFPPETEILFYNNPAKALKENKETKFDIAFLDIEMPEMSGIQLAKE